VTSGIASKGVDLDNIFDPYVAGTTKARAAGIAVAGSDTSNRFANIIYGSAAAATGIQSEGADINTLYAKKGTASYALPIDGQTFVQSDAEPAGTTPSAILDFEIGASGWTVVGKSKAAGNTTKASGSVPSGAVSVQVTDTWLNAAGDTDAGTVVNTASAYTTIPGTGTVGCSVQEIHGSTGTSGQTTHRIVINMKSAGGTVISTTTCTFVCVTSTG
jgi:hypothetical protein